ncbi:MAG: glycosyltransferase family 2 protein [Acidimicrobiales bacterium]|jgi:GT2 family glycosyltransferase
MPSEINTTVITVTWNSQSVIGGFLECLPAAMGEVPWQLVLADNGSHDSTVAIARQALHDVRVVQLGHNAGYAAGINAAVEAVQADTHLLISNPDVKLDAGSGQLLTKALLEPRVGIVVPQLRDSADQLVFTMRRDATVLRALGEALLGGDRAGRWAPFGETVTRVEPYAQPGDVDWASGAVMAISRECAERVGRWDESMWLYSEETDYCLRAREAGFRVRYLPDAQALHFGGESGENPVLWTALTVNRIRLFERRHSRLHTAAFRSAVTLNEALRALAGRSTSRAALRALTHSRRLAPPRPPKAS